jgi:hypothetical protein
MMAWRYAHAKQFNRNCQRWRILRARFSRIIRETHRARSLASRLRRGYSNGRLRAPASSVRNSSASAAGSCILAMLPRSNVSARERPASRPVTDRLIPSSSAASAASFPPIQPRNHSSRRKQIEKRNCKLPSLEGAKPCNLKPVQAPKIDSHSAAWPLFKDDYMLR